MNRNETEAALAQVHDAKERWTYSHAEFTIKVDSIMRRLIHEAAANRMSAEDVARFSGFTVKRVRALMRTYDLDPKSGSRLLSRKAAEALANNAELLGIEPRDMDLMSPLAYLPAGSELRKQMAAEQVLDEAGDSDAMRDFGFLETVHRCESFVPYNGSDNEFWCVQGGHIIDSSVMLQYREKYL